MINQNRIPDHILKDPWELDEDPKPIAMSSGEKDDARIRRYLTWSLIVLSAVAIVVFVLGF